MGRSGSHKAKSSPPSGASVRAAPEARIAELEAQLAVADQALKSQRSSYDEDATSFEKALARLAQSERSLSQTKARLVDTEALVRTERARAETISAELTAAKAAAAAEIALARESASAAEAREQQALAAARGARFGEAANAAELAELQGKVSALQIDLADCQAEVAAADERNAVLTHECTRLLSLLGSLGVLAREITHLTVQAATAEASLPKVEAWLGRDVESKHVRATVRPEAPSASMLKASRAPSAPEIVVDGVKLES
jgi:chromosome segregation ATPase